MKDGQLRVFITGASSGIGAALARHYAARGAMLGLTARRETLLQQIAAELSTQVARYPLDVRDTTALTAAAQDFVGRFGVPNIVIANAGISIGALTEHPEDLAVFRETLDTNVLGMVHTFHPFIAPMRVARQGSLAGIASMAGFRGLPGSGAYSASKAAAIAYLESLRVELRGSGIRVTTICPGYIRTPMTAENPYPMPFLMDADQAALRIARAIEHGQRCYTLPWQMAMVGRLLKLLPASIYDLIFSKAPHKLRRGRAS